MGPLGLPELLVILFIILLLFGSKKLPDLASGLGGAVANFKKAMRGDDDVRTLNAQNADDKVPAPAKTVDSTKV